MYFDVMDTYDEIRDPDTEEVLGSLDRPKVRVKTIHVQGKLALAKTYRTEKVRIDSTIGPFTRALMQGGSITRYETVSKAEGTKDSIKEEDSYVKVGDLVVQVIEADKKKGEDTNRT
jgi:hypothetical protein